MTTNKLPEWRKSLNEAVENYQSTCAWYEENQDSPSAEQDMDAAAGEIEKLIKQYGVLIVLNLLDEIDGLQERRKADSAKVANMEPVFFIEIEGDDWIAAGEIKDSLKGLADGVYHLYTTPQLAADDREPVFFVEMRSGEDIQAGRIPGSTFDFNNLPDGINKLYAAPQPELASEREQIRHEHAAWSQATFGDVGPVGPLKHLSKEALEAAAEPGDLSEWADMQFLLWDAQRRAGISDEQITLAMVDKLAINKQREWPEPKDGEPRLHIKAQPAPVVPDEKPMPEASKMYAIDAVAAIAEVRGWNACRDAMLQAGNSPVTPDGYILVPIVPTEDMIINGFESVPDPHFSDEKEWKEYEALSGCRKAAHRAKLCWAAMIKAAPKQENI